LDDLSTLDNKDDNIFKWLIFDWRLFDKAKNGESVSVGDPKVIL